MAEEQKKFESFFVGTTPNKMVDDLSELALDTEKFPKHKPTLLRAQHWRKFNEDHAKITNHGRIKGGDGDFKHIATVPKNLALAADWLEDGTFWVDEVKFEAWLKRNPQYKSYD